MPVVKNIGPGIKSWNFNPEPFQAEFFLSKARFPAMIAGWGTGKTMDAIAKGMDLSIKYPVNLGLIVRKNFTDLRDSTIKDFTLYTGIKVPTNKDVRLANGSEIMFRHMDELAGIIQNVNLGWFFIEQAEEFDTEEEFMKLNGRLRRKDCFRQGFIIANTNGHNWIWRLWKNGDFTKIPFDPDTGIPGVRYSGYASLTEANTFDNKKNLPEDWLASLKIMEKTAPHQYRRFVMNSWEDLDVTDRVIPYSDLMEAIKRPLMNFGLPKRVVSCDPAEFGDDYTIINAFEGYRIIKEEALRKQEPMAVAGHIWRMAVDINAQTIIIDDIGIGAGIRSRLMELAEKSNIHIIGINTGENAVDEERYKNRKAEIWWYARTCFEEGKISLPDDQELIEDLAAVSYLINSKGHIQIEKKSETRKKLGRSPDKGDAFVLGLWGLKLTPELSHGPLDDEDEMYSLAQSGSYNINSVFTGGKSLGR